jgi:metallo-beta-lactamase family protein
VSLRFRAPLKGEGTRGRKLLEGATEVKYMASTILFWQKIMEIKGLSAHGDQRIC